MRVVVYMFDRYREGCVKLKDLKAEIENIKNLMERNSQKMQKDFERWLDSILSKNNPPPMKAPVMAELSNVLKESNLNNSVTSSSSKSVRNFFCWITG